MQFIRFVRSIKPFYVQQMRFSAKPPFDSGRIVVEKVHHFENKFPFLHAPIHFTSNIMKLTKQGLVLCILFVFVKTIVIPWYNFYKFMGDFSAVIQRVASGDIQDIDATNDMIKIKLRNPKIKAEIINDIKKVKSNNIEIISNSDPNVIEVRLKN